MPEAAVATHEPLPSLEIERPSNALLFRVATGEPDTTKPSTRQAGKEVHKDSLTALHNQNTFQREKDAKEFAQRNQRADRPLSPEDIRHNHMSTWAKGATEDLINDLLLEGRGSKIAPILQQKLHIPLTGKAQEDFPLLFNSFYNVDSKTAGSFYNEFCTGNMNQKLANALTVDEMMHLKTFLTKWMLGSDNAFNALVTLRHTMDNIRDDTKRASLADAPLSPRDQQILDFYKAGLEMKPPTATPEQERETKESVPLSLRVDSGRNTRAKKEGRDAVNDDTVFIDEKYLQGGIFDGAGGYAGGDKAAKAAQEAVQQYLSTHPQLTEQEVRENLVEALAAANEAVRKAGGATTAAVFQIVTVPDGTRKVLAANVGDSRVWIRKADGSVIPITQDWNNLQAAYRAGTISKDDYERITRIIDSATKEEDLASLTPQERALFWDHRNETMLLGSTQLDKNKHIGSFSAPIEAGDTIFMTTDGVHDNLTTQQIEAIARATSDPAQFSRQLVQQARAVADTFAQPGKRLFRAKPDDITAGALRTRPDILAANPSGSEYEKIRALCDTLSSASPDKPIGRLVAEVRFTPESLSLLHTFFSRMQQAFQADSQLQQLITLEQTERQSNQGMQAAAIFNDVMQENNTVTQPQIVGGHIEVPSDLFEKYHAFRDFQTVQARLQRYESARLDKNNPVYGQSASMFAKELETVAYFAAQNLPLS